MVALLLLLSQVAQRGNCAVTELRVPRSTAVGLDGKVEAAVEINRSEYVDDINSIAVVQARFTLRNLTSEPIPFHFNSGQFIDWTIEDSHGEKIWKWSDGRLFAAAMVDRMLGSNPWEFQEEIQLASETNQPYPPGAYTLRAELISDKRIEISIAFRVIR